MDNCSSLKSEQKSQIQKTYLKLMKGILKVLLCFQPFLSKLLFSFLINKHRI